MTRSDRLIIAISAFVVLVLVALSAFFIIAKPLGAQPGSSNSSSDGDEDEEQDEDDADDDEQSDDLELSLSDLQSLADYAVIDGIDLTPVPNEYPLSEAASIIEQQWNDSAGAPEDCFAFYAAMSLLGADDNADSSEMATNIVGYEGAGDYLTDGYLGAFGRVLPSAQDAADLLDEFDDAVAQCGDGPFELDRGDGVLVVDSSDYFAALYDTPSTVTAFTVEFEVGEASDILGYRINIIQRGNAIVGTFAVVKSGSTFDETDGDVLAELMAEGLGDF